MNVIDAAGWGPIGADADQFVMTARPRGAPG
jgi:hypothetical protein